MKMHPGSSASQYTVYAALSHIALAVPDPSLVARFYREIVGLHPAPSPNTERIRLGMGTGAHALELCQGDGLDHLGLELRGERELEELGTRVAAHGLTATPIEDDDRLRGIAVNDPDGNGIELHGPVDRAGEHVADSHRRPIRIHHVTLGSPNLETMVDFYVSVLGFRVSDRMGDAFVWMRSNREHHSVAVVEADEVGLDHYAYEVADWLSLKTWCDELAVRDVPLTWGPGRHGPGNNLFVMFDDLAGNRIELSCEMERYWDEAADYAPRDWRPGVKTINLWGVAPSWRQRVAR